MSASTDSSQGKQLVYKPKIQPELGRIIKNARKAKKLTQQQLGEQLGVSNQTVASWEHGLRAPTESSLRRIAAALDEPDDSFFEKQEANLTDLWLHECLRYQRKKRGLSQVKLSEETGIPLVTIKAYEDPGSGWFISEKNMGILCEYFGAEREELLGQSWTDEEMMKDIRDSYLDSIKETLENLNLIGLKKAAEQVKKIAESRRNCK